MCIRDRTKPGGPDSANALHYRHGSGALLASYEWHFLGIDGVVHDASSAPEPCR